MDVVFHKRKKAGNVLRVKLRNMFHIFLLYASLIPPFLPPKLRRSHSTDKRQCAAQTATNIRASSSRWSPSRPNGPAPSPKTSAAANPQASRVFHHQASPNNALARFVRHMVTSKRLRGRKTNEICPFDIVTWRLSRQRMTTEMPRLLRKLKFVG